MFNAKEEVEKIVTFVRNYYEKNNLYGAVLGISGGKDSGVVAALLVKALGPERVVGVTLPCHSKESDKEDAKLVSDYYGFRLYNLDLTSVYDAFKTSTCTIGNFTEDETKESDINLKSRLRMCSVYYLARLLSDTHKKNYIVAGTSNKSELYVGYFTKGGDSVCDIALLADYNVSEVIQIGKYLNLPSKVLYRIPDDGMSGKTDEEKIGVPYDQIAACMENPMNVNEEIRTKIKKMHEGSYHKFNIPTYKRK